MYWKLISLRLNMARRFMRRLGVLRSLVIVLFFLGFASQIFLVDPGRGGHLALAVLMGAGFISIHSVRGDLKLLFSLDLNTRYLLWTEYGLIAIPLLLLLLIRGQWLPAILLSFAVLLLPFLSPGFTLKQPAFNRAGSLVPAQAYEWKAGLRRTWLVFSPLILLAPAVSFFHLMAGWACLFLLGAVSASHYRDCEPLDYIIQLADGAPSFLLKKLFSGTLIYAAVCVPAVAVLMTVYPEQAGFTLLFWAANGFLVSIVILGKYAFYAEAKNLELLLSVLFGIFCLMLIVPYLPVVAIGTAGWLAYRATRRLNLLVYV